MDINPNDVNGGMSPLEASPATPIDVPPAGGMPIAPGSKTPSELLLESLQQERNKVRTLEDQIRAQNTNPPAAPTDEKLKSDVASLKSDLARRDVLEANPILRDKWKDFEQFTNLPENAGMSMKTAAKAFLVENGLLEARRPGLENKTGGTATPMQSGMTPEEAEQLRSTNWREYQRKLMAGEIPGAK